MHTLLCAGAILEWLAQSKDSNCLRNQLGILTLRRTILELYRFLLCAERIHVVYMHVIPFLEIWSSTLYDQKLFVCFIHHQYLHLYRGWSNVQFSNIAI